MGRRAERSGRGSAVRDRLGQGGGPVDRTRTRRARRTCGQGAVRRGRPVLGSVRTVVPASSHADGPPFASRSSISSRPAGQAPGPARPRRPVRRGRSCVSRSSRQPASSLSGTAAAAVSLLGQQIRGEEPGEDFRDRLALRMQLSPRGQHGGERDALLPQLRRRVEQSLAFMGPADGYEPKSSDAARFSTGIRAGRRSHRGCARASPAL